MINKVFPDIRSAWEYAYFGILSDEKGVVDYYQRNIVHSYRNTLIIRSAVFDFDLGDIGLTPTKWTKFTGQYVDVETLHAWINSAPSIRTYDSLWNFKLVPPNFGGRRAVHRWGNCLLGFSFRRRPKPVLSLFTRAQSLGFSAVADYALADFVARQFAKRLRIPQEAIGLNVYCPNLFLKMVESIHYLTYLGRLDEFLEKDNRITKSLEYYVDYLNRDPADIPWRAAKRMRQKLVKIENGVHISRPVSELQLKGWDFHEEKGRKMTTEEASTMILTGKGKEHFDEDDEEEDEDLF